MRLIDADVLMELARNHVGRTVDCNDIARFPTIDAVPVVHARWEKTSDGCRTRCSFCKIKLPGVWYYNGEDCDENYEEIDATPFCPNCGAKMNENEEEHGQES